MSKNVKKVTELELKILEPIWNSDDGLSVGDIVEGWDVQTTPGYTTVLKTLQKMEKKDIVGHVSVGRKYKYFAKIDKDTVTKNRLGTIINGLFGGNKISFAEYFMNSNDLTNDELKELKELIKKKEQQERKK